MNETSVEQNNLVSFVSFDREHHCDQTYLGDENCVRCTEKFDEDDHLPILLPCDHIFCLKCTTVLARKKHYNYVVCPCDRRKHKIKYFQLKTMDANLRFDSNSDFSLSHQGLISDYTEQTAFSSSNSSFLSL